MDATAADPKAADSETSLFQCGSCKQQYKRLDHLARHVRSHTQSRPYKCPICTKAFARADLLKRHVAGHDASAKKHGSVAGSTAGSVSSGSASVAVSGRVTRACHACAANHLRCSEEKPCHRCSSKGLPCVWDRAADVAVSPQPTVASTARETITSSPPAPPVQAPALPQTPVLPPASSHYAATPAMEDMGGLGEPPLQAQQQQPTAPAPAALPSMGFGLGRSLPTEPTQPSQQPFMRLLSNFDINFRLPSLPDNNMMAGQWTPIGALDFEPPTSIDLDDMDFRFLDEYNTNLPFEMGVSPSGDSMDFSPGGGGGGMNTDAFATASGPRWSGPSATSAASGISSTTAAASSSAHTSSSSAATSAATSAAATDAFKRHYWRFRPNAQDHYGAEEHNLSLPSAIRDHPSPASCVSLRRRMTRTRLNRVARDKVLMVVTHYCRSENVTRVVTSFPSVELLDTLLQFYLASPVAQAESLLHLATFDPNTARAELVAAMAAAGAVLTADPALSKLGFAIQECLRIAVPTRWERDNSTTRDLELGQAFLLTLEIGVWSGRSRKVEIAESFFQPLLTMWRRNGCFGRASAQVLRRQDEEEYDGQGEEGSEDGDDGEGGAEKNDEDEDAAEAPSSEDADAAGRRYHRRLQAHWKAWVRQEAAKRFALRILQHDTSTSMALLTNPLISYAEVLLPLPHAADLWLAPTAVQWHAAYCAAFGPAGPPPAPALTLPAFLAAPEAFIATHRSRVDMAVACAAFLSCAWGLTWEYVQLSLQQREMAAAVAASGGEEGIALGGLGGGMNGDPFGTSHHTMATPGSSSNGSMLRASGPTGTTRRWETLVMESRREEIHRLMQSFRAGTEAAGLVAPELAMRTELVLMHTHALLEQVQLFAGMEGQEQARTMYPAVVEWVVSGAARKALWHAGQILRAARLLPRGVLRGAPAVMVYHAGLTLWAYGVVSQGLQTTNTAASSSLQTLAALTPSLPLPLSLSAAATASSALVGEDLFVDGPDSGLVLQTFFALGYGRPCLGGPAGGPGYPGVETVPLSAPDKVMAVIASIFWRNYDEDARPYMVDSLIKLLDGIQKASTAEIQAPARALSEPDERFHPGPCAA